MIARPSQFYILSLLMFAVALSFPIQVIFLYQHHWTEVTAIFSKLTWLNWLLVFSLITCSYLYLHASRAILVGLPLLILMVVINNYYVGRFAGDFSMAQTSLATAMMFVVFVPPLFMPSSLLVLKDPKRRWWRRSKRVNKRVPATLNPFVGEMIQAHTYDLSETGAFVCLEEESNKPMPKVGDTLRISLNVNSMRKIRCEAVVVRIAEPTGRYPRGLGLRFVDIDPMHQKSFKQFIDA